MSLHSRRATPCALVILLGSAFLRASSIAGGSAALDSGNFLAEDPTPFASIGSAAGFPAEFYDGRLVLHFPGKQDYVPGYNYFGNSGEPECDEVTAQVPAALDEISILYVLAVFPPGQEPPLRKVSFGIEYDPALLEILEFGADGSIEEQSFTWPAPGTSIHIRFDSVRWQQSTEAVWFAVRQLTETPAFLELQAGSFGGVVGSDHVEWPIEGFGAFGFGQEGQVDCPSLGTCCLAREGCRLLAERWCIKEHGEYLGVGESCANCSPVGACCDGWLCRLGTEAQCASAGWEYAGDGTVCEPQNVCIPIGACCESDGTCAIVQQNRCLQPAFFPGGTCDPSPCVALGACCYSIYLEFCVLTTEEDCVSNGSEYLGDGSVCTPESCLPGVCCSDRDVESCFYSTPDECTKAGGAFVEGGHGPPEEACWNVCCCGPTIDGSWGSVKSRFRERSR